MKSKRVVLISGCSSGIGLATARLFARRGWRVYATVRRESAGRVLRDEAAAARWELKTPIMDVTDEASVNAAVAALLQDTEGRIDVVINNAGRYVSGPLEQTTPDELQAQLDTNLLGVLRVCRAVLPAMRKVHRGMIVNVSSLLGLSVIPISGPYCISKWALEAFSETLRFELAPFSIRVTTIEPGPFASKLHDNEVLAAGATEPNNPYGALITRYREAQAGLRRADLQDAARLMYKAATTRNPKLRWPVGPLSFLGGVVRRWTPDWVYELVICLRFRLPPFAAQKGQTGEK